MNKEELKLKQDQHKLDVQSIMSTTTGRSFMHWLIGECGVYHSSADVANHRTNETFVHEGKRKIGLKLIIEINTHAPANYLKMLEEKNND